MSLHSELSSKKSQRLRHDGRILDFYGKKIKSNGHSASSISPVQNTVSTKLGSKSRQRPSCYSSPPMQAKKVIFFRNGDPFFKGVVLAISSKVYPSIDSLMLDASRHPICDVSVLPKGIRYVFSTDGARITSLDELQEGKGYVFSSTESFKRLRYGGTNPVHLGSRLSANTQHDLSSDSSYNGEELGQLELSVNEGGNFIPSRIIYIIRAGPRPRYTTKMTLNQEAYTSLDQVTDCIEKKLMMCKGGIKHLCSVSGNEVKCLKDLFEEDTIFIAFATEVISSDDLLLSAAELSTSPTGTKIPSVIVWTNNNLPRFPTDIKKPKIITVANRGHSGDERGIPFALLSKYKVSKTVIWTECAVMKRCYTKTEARQAVAMKVFDKSRLSNDELDAVYYELSMLRRLKHNNILHFVDEMDTIPELYVLVEYFKGTNLLDAILLSDVFTEREAGSLMSQLCSAISYLHSLSIIHRNIKPDNILVSFDRHVKDWHLRLVGLASAVQIKDDSISELCGTLEYAPPEMLQGLCYGSKVDMWSAGVVCYQMLSGLLPFTCSEASGDQQQLFQSILSGHVDFPSPCWDLISDSVKDLILHMLTRNPKLRCKASGVFSHSWLQTTTSNSPTYLGKNVDLRSNIVINLETSNPWISKTTKSCHMLLASSFCSPRKAYEERTSSPEHEARLSFSSHSALSDSDSDQTLFKHSVAPKGYRYISCPADVGAKQTDVAHVDADPSQSSLYRDSLMSIDGAHVHSNNVESSGLDFNSSKFCIDQSNSLICNRVNSLKTDAAGGNFESSHFCQDVGASVGTGISSSKSDIFSSHSVSTENNLASNRCLGAVVKQPCSASTQTTSSELFIHPAICPPRDPADDILSSSSSSATPSAVSVALNEVTHPEMISPLSRFPFPESLLFSTVHTPSSTYPVKPCPAQSTPVSLSTDYQLMTAQMCMASLGRCPPSGHDSSSGRLTNAKSTSTDSASSYVNPAHMENCEPLSNQSLAPPHGQHYSPPVPTPRPSKPPLSSTLNHSGLPTLQFMSSSPRSSSPPKQSQLQYAPSLSSSSHSKSSLASNLPLPQHLAQACQQNQLATARSFPQCASSPIQDPQRIQTLPQTSVQSSQAMTSNISPSLQENRNYTAPEHGLSHQPKESTFHPVKRQSLSVSHASTSTGINHPQPPAIHASPSQMLTAALKSFDSDDQGHTKDAKRSSANQRQNTNAAKVAVETVCWMSSKTPDREQTGKRGALLSASSADKKGSSPASSSSSHDEFLSPSSSIHDRGSGHSSQTGFSGLSEDDNDEDSTSSRSTHCSIKNRS